MRSPYLFTKADPSIDLLVKRFENSLLNADADIPCLKIVFKNLVDYVHKHYNAPNMDSVVVANDFTIGVFERRKLFEHSETC